MRPRVRECGSVTCRAATQASPWVPLSLSGLGTFDGKVVFLKPTDVPNLTNFHTRLVEAVGLSVDLTDNYFEGPRYCPHLTLGGVQWGMSEVELLLMKKRAETELADLPHFEISRVTVYQQNARHEPWQATRRILLGR